MKWLKILLLLLYKNFTVRKRHWKLGLLIEIPIPILLFVVTQLFVGHHNSGISFPNKVGDTYYGIESMEETVFLNLQTIYYIPENEFTSSIVDKITECPAKFQFIGLSSEDELLKVYYQHQINDTFNDFNAIIFNNVDGEEPIKNLDYTYRSTFYFPTDLYNTKFGDYYWPTDTYHLFARLQTCIDKSFINVVSPKTPLELQFSIQRMPDIPRDTSSSKENALMNIFYGIALLAFIVPLCIETTFPANEKFGGVNILMLMNGVSTFLHLLCWLITSLLWSLTYLIPIMIILMTSQQPSYINPFLYFGNGFIVWLMLISNVGHLFTFGMHLAAYFSKSLYMMTVILIVYVGTSALYFCMPNSGLAFLPYLGILFPNLLILRTFDEINSKEALNVGVVWSNLFVVENPAFTMAGSPGMIIILSILGACLHLALAIHIYTVMPGKYGARKSFFYFLQRKSVNVRNPDVELNEFSYDDILGQTFEKISKGTHVPGIQIRNLQKEYSRGLFRKATTQALRGISIDFYKGQITALLGHNGAGKTTLMSILSGMMSSTTGTVLINGKNIKRVDMKDLSLCPQENIVFPSLSVFEQIYFFGQLKNKTKTKKEITNHVKRLMQQLNLSDKRNALPATLSGGQKRRTCLAMAMIGDSNTLILDEPTSGLDPQSRREAWDIILKTRGEKTILISTHDMEEADILGDRIAIIHLGLLRCYGSTMYLKRTIGKGNMEVTLSTESWCNVDEIRRKIDPRSQIIREDAGKVALTVPFSNALPSILDEIESEKEELGVTGMSVSLMTLEQVFLRVTTDTNDEVPHRRMQDTTQKLQGFQLQKQIIFALLAKKFVYTLQNKSVLLFIMVLTLIYLLAMGSVNIPPSSKSPTKVNLDLYSHGETMYSSDDGQLGNKYEEICEKFGAKVTNANANANLNKALLDFGKNDVVMYNKYMIAAAEFNRSQNVIKANALYSSAASHSVSITINLMSNALLNKMAGDEYSISVSRQRLVTVRWLSSFYKSAPYSISNILTLVLLLIPAVFVIHPLREHVTNAKQLQRICGVTGISYWFTMFIFDFIVFLIAIAVILIGLKTMDTISELYIYQEKEIRLTALILIMFAINALPLVYIFSFLKKSIGAVVTIVNLAFIAVLAVHGIMYILVLTVRTDLKLLHKIQKLLLLSIPHVSIIHSYIDFHKTAFKNGMCRKFSVIFANNPCYSYYTSEYEIDCCKLKCANGICENGIDYFESTDITSFGNCLIYWIIMPFIFFGILALLEYNVIPSLFMRCRKAHAHLTTKEKDEQVKMEKLAVAAEINNLRTHQQLIQTQNGNNTLLENRMENGDNGTIRSNSYLFLVHELSKAYGKMQAVKEISFGVKQHECFGLLGVNGAGKSTSFRLLTGEELPDTGIMYLGDKNIRTHRAEYLMQMGYCPQNDAIIDCLTAIDHLRLFARLRGIPKASTESEVEKWINRLNLNLCASQPSGTYSGGNKRRLNIAMALIGNPNLVLMDEPTTGIDPAARRSLWNVIQSCQESGQAVILTSHSMEECEILCNRLAIMVGGQLVCIGSCQALKQRFGVGFDIQIKLNAELSNNQTIKYIKKDLENALPCKLVDENSGYLMYHVTSVTTWKKMYDVMDELKMKYDFINDFCILSSTLEQLFLLFAREAEEKQS